MSDKNKKLNKGKKICLVFILLLVVISISIGIWYGFFYDTRGSIETKKQVNNTYTMYVGMDFLTKVTFKESYQECIKDQVSRVCSEKNIEVAEVQFIDDKATNLFKDINFKQMNLTELFVKILEISDYNKINITSNYSFDIENLKKDISKKVDEEFEIINYYQTKLVEKEIIEDYELSIPYYMITFDTDGGTSIDSVVVRENGLIIEPKMPTKSGYSFIEWQLDGKKYDFASKVTNDITLKAKWKKNQTLNNNTGGSNNQNTNTNTNNNTISNNKINLNDNIRVSQKYSTILCGFGMFATNFKSVFPKWGGDYCPFDEGCLDSEVSSSQINQNINNLKFDTTKEKNAKALFEKTKKNLNTYTGIKSFEYKIENHRYSYDLYYLDIVDGSFKTDGMNINNEISGAMFNTVKFYGPCGGNFSINETLTEELCKAYNLNCGRW